MQIFSKQVAAAKNAQAQIQVDGKDLPNFNPGLTDYYLEASQGKAPTVTASVTENGIATVVPSVGEGDPVRVVVKAENGDILGEYRLHFTMIKICSQVNLLLLPNPLAWLLKDKRLSYQQKFLSTSQENLTMK